MYHGGLVNTTLAVSIRKVNISRVQSRDISGAVDFLVKHYFRSQRAELNKNPETVKCLRNFCINALHQNVSLVGTTGNGTIATVSCNVILRKDENFGIEPDAKRSHDFVKRVMEECDFREMYASLDDYMYIVFMYVHEEFANQGLPKSLMECSRKLAVEFGLKVLRIDCWDLRTAKTAQKMGATCLKEVNYKELKVNEKLALRPHGSHTTLRIYILKTEHGRFLAVSL